jgi:hypothetical protein
LRAEQSTTTVQTICAAPGVVKETATAALVYGRAKC